MKHIKQLTLVLIFLIAGSYSTQTHALFNGLKNLYFTLSGYGDVEDENEKLIRAVQKEMGMEDWNILARTSNSRKIRLGSIGLYSAGIVIVDQAWFNSLSPEEKRFAVGRELTQMKTHHLPKRLGVGCLASAAGYMVLHDLSQLALLPSKHGNNDGTRIAIGSVAMAVTIAALLKGLAVYSCHSEHETDKLAATELDCARGGVMLFSRLKQEMIDSESTLDKWGRTRMYPLHVLLNSFNQRPPVDQRIDNLVQLAIQQDETAEQNAKTSRVL